MTKICFTKKECSIILELMTVGSCSMPGIEQYQYGYKSTNKMYKESQIILKKLGMIMTDEEIKEIEGYKK